MGLRAWMVGTLFFALASAAVIAEPAARRAAAVSADCARLEQLHARMQANPHVAKAVRDCRGLAQVNAHATGVVAKGANAVAQPQGEVFGGSDINLVTGAETFPATTQGGSTLAANGTTIVAVYTDTRDALDSYSGVSVSTDGGINFTRLDPNPFLSEFGGDFGAPSVAYDPVAGQWLAVALSDSCGAQGIAVMSTATPADSASWSAQACAHSGSADDRPILWIAANGHRFISFNDFAINKGALKVMVDTGGGWNQVIVNDGVTTFLRNVHLTGGASGALYLFAMNEGGGSANNRTNIVYRSNDPGATWTATQIGNAFLPPGTGLCADSDYYQMIPPNWREMGWGQGAVGPDGTVHYIYSGRGQVTNGEDDGDIYYVRSTTAGTSWSTPVILNSDHDLNLNSYQWQPSISVTAQGHVLAAWYDRRNTTDGSNYQYFGRQSLNNGVSFQADKPISDLIVAQPSQVDPARSFCFAGDSNFHIPLENDSLVAWTDGRNAIANGNTPPADEPQMDAYFKRVPLCPTITLRGPIAGPPSRFANAQQGTAYNQSAVVSGGIATYTFTLAGSLPDGLGLNTGTGTISGTPSTAGITPFGLVVTDSFGCEGSAEFNLIVDPPLAQACPAISIAPTTLPNGAQGALYDQTVTASGGAAAYAYTVTAGALPVGVVLEVASGQIHGVPQESQSFAFGITARDANGCTGTRYYANNVACPAITLFPPTKLPDGYQGLPYLSNITANGGTPPYRLRFTTGTRHRGIALTEGGTVHGVMEGNGNKNFTIEAIDVNGCVGSQGFGLRSNGCPDGALFCSGTFDLDPTGDGDPADFVATNACGNDASWHATTSCASSGDIGHNTTNHMRFGDPDADPLDLNNPSCANYGTTQGQGALDSREFDVARCNGGAVLLDFNYVLGFKDTDLSERARVVTVADGGAPMVMADNGGNAAASCGGPASAGLGNLKPHSGWQNLQLEVPAENNFKVSFIADVANGDNNAGEGFLVDDVMLRCKCPDDFVLMPETLDDAIVGSGYVVTFETQGGVPPYAYQTLPGNPPPAGMTLNAVSGVLSGTPTTPGLHSFTVETTDSNGCSLRKIYTLIVSPGTCPTFGFDPLILSGGTVDEFYAETVIVTAAVAPLSYSVTQGVLPPGLSLNPTTGTISGLPNTAGLFEFTIGVVDANLCVSSIDYSVTIAPANCPTLEITPTLLPNALAGSPYSELLGASNGTTPYQWNITGGVLPAGLALDGDTGMLAGTPTSGGSFDFDVTVQDADLCPATRSYTLTVTGCPVVEVQPETLPNPVTGVYYTQSFSASGGIDPYAFARISGALPPGLILGNDGLLAGTPTTTGPYSFVVAATDTQDCSGVRGYSLVVGLGACPTITLAPEQITNEAIVGQAYSQPTIASGGTAPYTYAISAGALPTGLVLVAADDPLTVPIEPAGTIQGTATVAGVYSFRITASDLNTCSGLRNYNLIVNPAGCPEIQITPTTLAGGQENVAYNESLSANGGVGPYTWGLFSGSLPNGLVLNPSTGVISGTPTSFGNFTFVVRVQDGGGCFAIQEISLSVSSEFLLFGIFRDGFE